MIEECFVAHCHKYEHLFHKVLVLEEQYVDSKFDFPCSLYQPSKSQSLGSVSKFIYYYQIHHPDAVEMFSDLFFGLFFFSEVTIDTFSLIALSLGV